MLVDANGAAGTLKATEDAAPWGQEPTALHPATGPSQQQEAQVRLGRDAHRKLCTQGGFQAAPHQSRDTQPHSDEEDCSSGHKHNLPAHNQLSMLFSPQKKPKEAPQAGVPESQSQ